MQSSETAFLLPSWVKPHHYELSLHSLQLESSFTYQGTVYIHLTVARPTDHVWLHAKDLDIIEARVVLGDSTTIEHIHLKHDKELERIAIHFPTQFHGAGLRLMVRFSGVMNNALAGFYRTRVDATGSDKEYSQSSAVNHIYSTQFQSCDARRAFPCFDEPNLKATFDLELEVPDYFTALSNMPERQTVRRDNGLKTVTFERTPIMSTYLLAWAIGKFEYIEARTARQYNNTCLPVRIYTEKGFLSQAQYALQHAVRVLDFYSDLFKIDYPLPKVDLVAIPGFAHEAMENWGLCTFQATALLCDDAASDLGAKERASYVIAHELAHQWFGNLVTFDWWHDLWLNEGFATWAGWLAVDHFHPDWYIWRKFEGDRLQNALQRDALRSTHPIQTQVVYGPDIDQIFDEISYQKGSSLIRMLNGFLGQHVFLMGITNYLNRYAYGNATSGDLWTALSQVSGEDVSSFMNPWLQQAGFPLLSADYVSGALNLSQQRFLLTNDITAEESTPSWWIPLRHSPSGSPSESEGNAALSPGNGMSTSLSISMTKESMVTEIGNLLSRRTGFYRVDCSYNILNMVQERLEHFSVEAKVRLLGDLTAMAVSGKKDVVDALRLINYLHLEKDYFVWLQISKTLGIIGSIFSDHPNISNGLESYTLRVLEAIISHVSVTNISQQNSHTAKQLRGLLFSMAGMASHKRTVQLCIEYVNSYAAGSATEDQSIRSAAFHVAASHGNYDDYLTIKRMYALSSASSTADFKETCLSALAQNCSSSVIKAYIEFLFSPAVQVQDLHIGATALAARSTSRILLWQFMKNSWETVVAKFDGALMSMDKFVRVGLSGFADITIAQEIESFFAGRDTTGFGDGVKVVVDKIGVNSAFRKRGDETLAKWLAEGHRD